MKALIFILIGKVIGAAGLIGLMGIFIFKFLDLCSDVRKIRKILRQRKM